MEEKIIIYKGKKFLTENAEPEKNWTPLKRSKKAVLYAFCFAALLMGVICLIAGSIGYKSNTALAESLGRLTPSVTPVYDKDAGCYVFETDRELKILQLSDLHFGAGHFSVRKDGMVIRAVDKLIKRARPDLVIFTGDVAFPMSLVTGSLDNLKQMKLFTAMMSAIDLPYTYAFGNHDATGGLYSQKQISDFLAGVGKNCLYEAGPTEAAGYGNHYIAVKNSSGRFTQILFILDTHSYVSGVMKYDSVKKSQVDFYQSALTRLKNLNGGEPVNSLIFQHIPGPEYQAAWSEFEKNGFRDTADVKYFYGRKDESISCGSGKELFEAVLGSGSTKGIFAGHDHMNDFSVSYKGVRLTFTPSIDYTAYPGLEFNDSHRGGTLIKVSPSGSFACERVFLK